MLFSRYIFASLMASIVSVQAQNIHSNEPPDPNSFDPPPKNDNIRWLGPFIQQAGVRCWHLEPDDPTKPVGGTNELQSVIIEVPLEISGSGANYKQSNFLTSGGGMQAVLSAAELPEGLHISIKAHPVYRLTKVEYPVQVRFPPIFGPARTGVRVLADFLHGPTMGECYFAVAVWAAQAMPPMLQ
jgi:hypothetical protein